ncbi:uncharacterized protein MONBRDRAFT_34910 [Monosiga brevicollis MX1]|uniref:NEDD8-activating enzyme E1 catalytic subunit n=1 Tax=Monosiga brevicollis TaxID=81824 RepID=A9US66_MONBE|nr:uncharacterized protein MONBRDRAFT_34910 [Monosiga brevicollis MX1]EDQ92048.1 predicted protein [Monosiga brevicollis MX1]|eukprot:XP_001743334.1 hypothetical protein [Monosiga brevicollis MX1]
MAVEGKASGEDSPARWQHNDRLLTRTGPLAVPGFEPIPELRDFLMNDCRVLVIGAGGLGCELLKDLALCGFRRIDVIDMDTIDVSNLNRQFLFRPKDVGRDKATVAAEFINRRIPGCQVTPHFNRIEDHDPDFYRQFQLVVCGLDSVAARRWINNMLLSLLQYDDEGQLLEHTIIPLIDGGTEGFKGNARVIIPGKTACVECMLDLFPPQVNFPMCTIANTPRLPEHCIEYAKIVQWPKERPNDKLDGDDPEHIRWLHDKAAERAGQFGITGVNYSLTQGVVKRIIPNVASTSAVIAAACANEAFKLASSCAPTLNNYVVFNDTYGVYTHTFEYERKPECLACSRAPRNINVEPHQTLTMLLDELTTRADFQFRGPGLTTSMGEKNKTLYMTRPPALEEATRPNLDKTLQELGLVDGQIVNVTDPTSPIPLRLRLRMPTAAMDTE